MYLENLIFNPHKAYAEMNCRTTKGVVQLEPLHIRLLHSVLNFNICYILYYNRFIFEDYTPKTGQVCHVISTGYSSFAHLYVSLRIVSVCFFLWRFYLFFLKTLLFHIEIYVPCIRFSKASHSQCLGICRALSHSGNTNIHIFLEHYFKPGQSHKSHFLFLIPQPLIAFDVDL